MYTYEIIKVSETNKHIFGDLYKNHFSLEKEQIMNKQMDEGRCKYYVVAKSEGIVIGCMGIREKEKDFYSFLILVVHLDHRGKQVATNIIKNAVTLLTDMGATKIRNHKRENIIPHSVFTDLGFVEVPYPDDEWPLAENSPYKWTYELTVGGTDGN